MFGQGHTNTSRARCQLARAYLLSGRAADALAQADIASANYRVVFGNGHDATREADEIAAEARKVITRVGETAQAPAE
jgi:hypothetical protein